MKHGVITFMLLAAIFLAQPEALARVSARAAILVNLDTCKVLYEKNADQPIPPASLTKIMTMFLALDKVSAKKMRLNQKIVVRKSAASVGGSSMKLLAGEKVPLIRLLSGMAVVSGNDAATAVAEGIAGSSQKFVDSMNQKARQLGLSRTRFKNPTGLPAPGQKTTARDMMKLCRAYLRKHPEAMRFHNITQFAHKGAVLRNTNALLGVVPGVDGLKTGWTVASGYNLVVTAKRGNTRLLAVILGANTKEARSRSARELVEAGFKYPGKPSSARLALK